MSYKIPKPTDPLTIHDFKPGFAFMVDDAGKWEKVIIHKNCAEELIAYTIRQFQKSPGLFKRA